ncbi:TetR/AcrR family transcriptional regulator [Isoptericola rhizosphaerae]|uniref:TetR/AcrR family transcriptional regulator n=1 Tax=Isoptericola rhizosphaerae TaxID=3377837 RepID=UPI00383B2C88
MSAAAPSGRDALLDRVIAFLIENGVGDASLRAVAAAAGTSHRMLIYHFGSREGLLTAVVTKVWQSQRETMEELADATPHDPKTGAWSYWTMVADHDALAPLVFELSAQAMHGAPWKDSFTDGLQVMVEQVGARLVAAGEPSEEALPTSRMCVAVMLGALWELRLTGDRTTADTTVRTFLDARWPTP